MDEPVSFSKVKKSSRQNVHDVEMKDYDVMVLIIFTKVSREFPSSLQLACFTQFATKGVQIGFADP